MTWVLTNIPLMVLFVALWVGIPTWLVLRRPDTKPELAAAPAVRTVTQGPVVRHDDGVYRRAA
jgi:hypothetical protein